MVQAAMETELQRLLRERLEHLETQWRDNAVQRKRIDTEAERLLHDMAALREAMTVESRLTGQPIEPPPNGTINVSGRGLRDAIEFLDKQQPGMSQKEIRRFLDSVHFDFKGKKPGNAINMARVALRRKKQ